MLRNDIVVIEYTKDESTGVESAAFKVIAGTPAASDPADPSYQDMDIRTGVFVSQKPFCRVRLNGVAIEGVDMLVEVKEFAAHAFQPPAANLTTTKPGQALDATMGKELKEGFDQLNSSLSVKSEEIVIGVWLDQNGHEATLRFRLGERSFAPNQWNTICTLPEGVRPVGPINFVLYDNLLNNNEEQRPILCEISGENVNIYAFADKTTMAPYGSATFIFENRDPET